VSAGERGEAAGDMAKPPAMPAPAEPQAAPTATSIRSDALFGGAREVQIEHHGVVYRLKQTALGKLILTK
jgi:hemin uptake protein HemP